MSDYYDTNYIDKDPDAVLDYSWDWTLWLADISDSIASHSIIIPVGLTCDSSSVVGDFVVAWISGGTLATSYQVVCRVVTTGGRTDDRSIYVKIVGK